MGTLQESQTYEVGVYQLETTDPVFGGPDGISNRQAKQLANRTAWLKAQLDEVVAQLEGLNSSSSESLGAHVLATDPHAQYAQKNGAYPGLRAQGTTKDDVGLGAVPNYPATSSATDGSEDKLATAAAVKALSDAVDNRFLNLQGDTVAGHLQSADPHPIYAKTDGTYAGLRAQGTTKDDVDLGNVPNYPATSSVNDSSAQKLATASAVKAVNDALGALRGSFQRSASAVGYQKLPGGLILQWGRVENANGAETVIFPIAFPTEIVHASVCEGGLTTATVTVGTRSQTRTSMVVTAVNSAHGGVFGSWFPLWFAIGY